MTDKSGGKHPGNRWYDRDPVLCDAVEQLRQAPDKYQAQIALNIIKIVVEHQMEDESQVTLEDLDNLLKQGGCATNGRDKRRWYDVNETLGSAMQLLHDCPDDLQQRVIPSIVLVIEQALAEQAC
jgi:hypothetical protein